MQSDFRHIRELEELLLSGETRGNEAELKRLLSPNFVEFGASGKVWNRDEIIRRLPQHEPAERTIDNFQARQLAAGAVLVTYHVRRCERDGLVAAVTLRSSVWVEEGEGWRMLFHQGTPQPL